MQTILVDPHGDATQREFVESVDDDKVAEDIVKHITAHSPTDDKCFKQWGARPFDAKRDFDRSRWVEKPNEPILVEP